MLIGSLVELHVGLHSCLCFSHLEKLVLKASLTPPRSLAIYRASLAFSYCNPDCSSTPTGSIEIASASSIASRHLLDRSRLLLPPRQLLDTFWIDRDYFCLLYSFSTPGGSIEILIRYLLFCSSAPPRYLYLSTTIFSIPSSTDISTPPSIEWV